MTLERGAAQDSHEMIIPTACQAECHAKCVLKAHVKDGTITKIESDDAEEPQLRACAKGRASRQVVYAPDRLKHPMMRIGERGEGRFKAVSWDVALDVVARELKRVKESYGPSSILYVGGTGSNAQFHTKRAVSRLLNLFGGHTTTWASLSNEGRIFANRATYNTQVTSNSQDDLLNSRLIIIWGFNPAYIMEGTNTSWYLAQAKEKGTRIVVVDPRFTDSAATFAHQWIPIRPGTDAAMMLAMAYVMLNENLRDQKFLETYTVGFEKFREYVLGREDGVPKTPVWAEPITGVAGSTIAELARLYATTKPASLLAGFGPGRSAAGEQYHRAAHSLAAMTGNIGIPGGSAGAVGPCPHPSGELPFLPEGENPVESEAELQPGRFSSRSLAHPVSASIHKSEVFDAILKGRAGGYPSDYKLLYVTNRNPLNQFANINKSVQALKSLEFTVVHEQFMTPTAKFADILLPVNTHFERNDVGQPRPFTSPYYLYLNKAVDSLYESKSDFQICLELAPRLGVLDYSDKTEDEWLRVIAKPIEGIVKYGDLRRKGVHKGHLSRPLIAFEKQIQDPAKHPFATPSGKIEIYSQFLAEMDNSEIPPVPKYLEHSENLKDPLAEKYPLQLITPHPKRQIHSSFHTVPWLRELESHAIWINSADAQARGIAPGNKVKVFNDRGEMVIPAFVTERILPGVVSVDQGSWYDPDEKGVDRGGCANVLTKDGRSPGGAFPCNTCLVEVRKE